MTLFFIIFRRTISCRSGGPTSCKKHPVYVRQSFSMNFPVMARSIANSFMLLPGKCLCRFCDPYKAARNNGIRMILRSSLYRSYCRDIKPAYNEKYALPAL